MPELAPAPEESAEVFVLQLRMQRISFYILQTGEGLSKVDTRRFRKSKPSEASEQPVLILSPGLPELSEWLERQVAHSVPPFPPELPVFPVEPAVPEPVAEPAFVVPESELAAAAVQVSAADRMFELPAAGQHPDPVVYCERRMEPRDFPQRFPVFWKDQNADIELFVVLFPADRSSG